jgi:predicted RNA binding protein YcfA (HicA-like mRNA interferase family)
MVGNISVLQEIISIHHPDKIGIVTVPHPKKNIPIGTLKSIKRQSGIKFNK